MTFEEVARMADSANPSATISRKDIVVIASLVVMSFAVENTLGLVLLAIVGIPLVGGMLSAVLYASALVTLYDP